MTVTMPMTHIINDKVHIEVPDRNPEQGQEDAMLEQPCLLQVRYCFLKSVRYVINLEYQNHETDLYAMQSGKFFCSC